MTTKDAVNGALKVIGLTGLAGVTVVAPNALTGLDKLLKKSSEKAKRQRLLAELKRQGLVHVSQVGDEYIFTLTPKGAHRLQSIAIDEIKIEVPKKWDKKWRAVAFDVPVSFSKQRAAFVSRLQKHGFVMIQKSVWAHPAPCFDQLEQLAGHYNVLRYCTMMEISKIDELSFRRLIKKFPDLFGRL